MFLRKIRKACRLIPYSHTDDFRSRVVILAPGKEIGEHSTRDFEELIFVLEGMLCITDFSSSISASAPSAALIPRRTRHNVINKSKKTAKYVYVICKKEK